jgi:hypothetical protein
MAKQVKKQKSSHLRELEDVFERRTRRFSPFEVLGLKSTVDIEREIDAHPALAPLSSTEEKSEQKSDPPTPGPDGPIPGMGSPTPGMDGPIIVVEEGNITTTNMNTPTGGSDPPTPGPDRPRGGSDGVNNIESPQHNARLIRATHSGLLSNSSPDIPMPSFPRTLASVADIVAATQAGSLIGSKARKILAYLNTIRSIEYEAYTVPIGYGQISSHVGVDSDYLRRKALPKLAMLGLIAIARKSLEGTVYHLPHDREYIAAVTGESFPITAMVSTAITSIAETTSEVLSCPEWIDKEQWGWLSRESIQRLVQKAGTEAQAREKLDIIIYNETHGASHQRVRNRRSILAHYLSSPQADIWPNDDRFETLVMKQNRSEKEQAQKEKTLAEEMIRAKREAQKARFSVSLFDSQINWIKQEAKRLVDKRPEAKLLTSRFPLYKAEEERLLEEWMERVGYGETVPSIQGDQT